MHAHEPRKRTASQGQKRQPNELIYNKYTHIYQRHQELLPGRAYYEYAK
jgi:hypothetical protein